MAEKNAKSRRPEAESTNPTVRRFIEGLELLEEKGQAASLLALFSEDCVTGNCHLDEPMRGMEGARQYWHDYRNTFDDIQSRFSRITETGDVAVLEWTSRGTLKTGHPIEYRGVSILTLEGSKISDFIAYFDSKPFTAHL